MRQGEHLEQVVPLQHVTEGYTDERSEKKFLVCQIRVYEKVGVALF
jgi:hypothetical protein